MTAEAPGVLDLGFMFVERINRRDLAGLLELMTDDHTFIAINGEVDRQGIDQMREAWRGYFDLCPQYMIHLREAYEAGDKAVLVGSTTGSHLKLPRREEFDDVIIWVARVRDGKVDLWQILFDTPENRRGLGIPMAGGQS